MRALSVFSNLTGLYGEVKSVYVPGYPDAPAAPSVSSVHVLNSSASVYWSLPASNGGAPITQYYLEISVESTTGFSTVAVTNSTFANVTNLLFSQIYYLRVTALNPVGISEPSAVASFQYGYAPSVPSVPTVVKRDTNFTNSANITLQWNAPVNNSGPAAVALKAQYSFDNATWVNMTVYDNIELFTFTASILAIEGQKVYVRSLASNRVSASTWSAVSSHIIAGVPRVPDTPTVVGPVLLQYTTSYNISWSAPVGYQIDGYLLTIENCNSTTTLNFNVTTTKYTANNITGNCPLFVSVAAHNVFGYGEASTRFFTFVTALPPKPAAIRLGDIPAGPVARIPISFTPLTIYLDAALTERYRFEYITSTEFVWRTLSIVNVTEARTFSTVLSVVTSRTPVTYSFRAFAVSAEGDSVPSDTSSVVLVATPVQPVIRNLNVNVNDTGARATFMWTPDTNADYFNVMYYSYATARWSTPIQTINTSVTVEDLVPGVKYGFRVQGINSAVSGPQSSVVQKVMAIIPSNSVTDQVPAVTRLENGTYSLSWNPYTRPTGANISYQINVQKVNLQTLVTTNYYALISVTLSSFLLSLEAPFLYSFTITTYNSAGVGATSLPSVPVSVLDVPTVPTGLNISSFAILSDETIGADIEWNPLPSSFGVDKYEIIYSLDNENWISLGEVPCCDAIVHGVNLSSTLNVSLRAHNLLGWSDYANYSAVAIVLPGAMLKPTLSNFSIDLVRGGSLDVSWLPANFTGGDESPLTYRLQSKLSNQTTWSTLLDLTSRMSYHAQNLQLGATYSYRTAAHNSAGYGPDSSSASKSIISLPGPVSNLTVVANSGVPLSVQITWNASVSLGLPVTGYIVEVSSIIEGYNYSSTFITNLTTISINPLINGKNYTALVRAQNDMGQGDLVATNFSVQVKPLQPPIGFIQTGLTISQDEQNATFRVQWMIDASHSGLTRQEVVSTLVGDGAENSTWTIQSTITAGENATSESGCFIVYDAFMSCFSQFTVPAGYRYTYKVRAANEYGYGVDSLLITAVSALPPSLAGEINGTTTHRYELRVSGYALNWHKAYSGGAKNVSYSVYFSTDSPAYVQRWTLKNVTTSTIYDAPYQVGTQYPNIFYFIK